MISIRPAGAPALALLIAACGEKQNPAAGNRATAGRKAESAAADKTNSGTGPAQFVPGDQMAIAQGPIAAIGWPATAMAFIASPDAARGAKVGANVDFSFRRNGSADVPTWAKPK